MLQNAKNPSSIVQLNILKRGKLQNFCSSFRFLRLELRSVENEIFVEGLAFCEDDVPQAYVYFLQLTACPTFPKPENIDSATTVTFHYIDSKITLFP